MRALHTSEQLVSVANEGPIRSRYGCSLDWIRSTIRIVRGIAEGGGGGVQFLNPHKSAPVALRLVSSQSACRTRPGAVTGSSMVQGDRDRPRSKRRSGSSASPAGRQRSPRSGSSNSHFDI
jgi:hypothetical protein